MSGPRGCFFVPTRAVRFLRAVTGSGNCRVKGRAVNLVGNFRRRFVRDAGGVFNLRAYLVGLNRRLVLVSGKK